MTAAAGPSADQLERSADPQAHLHAEVVAALGTVRDPELDEPVTSLGFVSACAVSPAGEVVVRLRLPTYFCAPNFAFLMVADAYDAVSRVPGVRRAEVYLDDHFAAETINAGVAAGAGFGATFGRLADGELDGLRTDFLRKAVLAGTDRVCRALLRDHTADQVVRLRLGDAPDTPDRSRLQGRRAQLHLPAGDDDPLVIDPVSGAAVERDALELHLTRARLTRVSIDANSGVCRGMLRERYATAGVGEREEH